MTDLELILKAMVADPDNEELSGAAMAILQVRPSPEPGSPDATQRYKNPTTIGQPRVRRG